MQALSPVEAIHQVLIVDGFGLPERLPETVLVNAECARALHPEASYHLWTGDALREYLRDNFDKDVLSAFDTLVPYSYKCDLARFCLLYASGGIYLDLAVRMVNRWSIPDDCSMAAFTEMYPGMMSWTATQTSLLWSKPRRPEWQHAIGWIVENCRNRYYGPHDHYPTAGPLLGRAIAAAMAAKGQTEIADDQWIGECRYATPERQLQNLCYVAPDKSLIGLRTKLVAGDLSEMGLSGTNNYCQIWRARKVYGELVNVWKGDDPLLHLEARATRTPTGIAVAGGTVGRVQYGPFVTLKADRYRLRLAFSPDTRFRKLYVDLSARYGAEVLHRFEFESEDVSSHAFLEFDFDLHDGHADVEFRTTVFGDFAGELRGYTLRPLRARTWLASDDAIGVIGLRRGSDGIAIPKGSRGRLLYGPYITLGPGTYTIEFMFAQGSRFRNLVVEICLDRGNVVDQTLYFRGGQTEERRKVEFTFCFTRQADDVEFRVETLGDFVGVFLGYTLDVADDDSPLSPQPNNDARSPRLLLRDGHSRTLQAISKIFRRAHRDYAIEQCRRKTTTSPLLRPR